MELIGSGGECQGEPESLTGLVHQERQVSTLCLTNKSGNLNAYHLLDYHLVISKFPLASFFGYCFNYNY